MEELETINGNISIKVSIIIPCFNCAETVANTISSLISQDLAGNFEIIVVDNNSTDNSREVVATFEQVRSVIEDEIQNAAATRNQGIAQAAGEIIAFTDADCVPRQNWLTQGIKALQTSQADFIGGRVVVEPLTPQSSTAEMLDTLYSFSQKNLIKNYRAAMTGNLMIKKSAITKIGWFDETLNELEDIDLGMRLSAAGFAIAYAPDCIVSHPPRTTAQQVWHKSKRSGHGGFWLCQKNAAWAGRWGWKHPLRIIRNFLSPRGFDWHSLPFDSVQLSLTQRIKIRFYSWFLLNLPESLGYLEAWIKFVFKS
ncbi:glycosyltransferase [Sphaerothrix gracilis]|uniref:glycosyltransferase n=1 Tax=Sphaerothrix gracilis TaxID=3151835 RepID=UPI0031FD1196